MWVRLPPLRPMHRWCNGSTRVSKTFCPGSNPGLCVLRCALIREAYILVTRLNSEVGSTPTASANSEAGKNSFSNLHAVETSKHGAVGKLVKPQDFQSCVCGFNSRRHCQISIGRLAYQRGQLSVKQPLLALQVRLLPDRPSMESNPVRRSALFAKQMG